jgi:ent-kaurenoic acid hydroxylase
MMKMVENLFGSEYIIWRSVWLMRLLFLQAEQEAIMRSIPPTQQGLTLRDFRKMEYLSQVTTFSL